MLNVGYKAKISHMADVSILLTILSKKYLLREQGWFVFIACRHAFENYFEPLS